jgi:hypothetical protein
MLFSALLLEWNSQPNKRRWPVTPELWVMLTVGIAGPLGTVAAAWISRHRRRP